MRLERLGCVNGALTSAPKEKTSVGLFSSPLRCASGSFNALILPQEKLPKEIAILGSKLVIYRVFDSSLSSSGGFWKFDNAFAMNI